MDIRYGYYPKYDFFNHFFYEKEDILEYQHYSRLNYSDHNSSDSTNYRVVQTVLKYLNNSNTVLDTNPNTTLLLEYISAKALYLVTFDKRESNNQLIQASPLIKSHHPWMYLHFNSHMHLIENCFENQFYYYIINTLSKGDKFLDTYNFKAVQKFDVSRILC